MSRILIVGDSGTPTGYGRIADETGVRLHRRGWQIMATGWYYDGLLPPHHDGQPLPYHVAALANKPNAMGDVMNVINAYQPDVVVSIQDFPYAINIFQSPGVDWSRIARVLITPVDGTPISPAWLDLLPKIDGALTISEFGVNAFREAGHHVGLCRPGINPDRFYRLPADQRAAIRAKLGVGAGDFLLGTMAQNQGRKAISIMLECFFEFAKDKPGARYLLDMDETSPAGWDINDLCRANGWDRNKLIFRVDAVRLGVSDLRDRYNALDAHAVLAHREGYGLPLVEAMACGVVSMAMDYCSGTEIVGEGRGCLIKHTGYSVIGTWGGARDYMPDKADFVRQLQWLYDNPLERAAMAERGMAWARVQTWDMAADNVAAVLERAVAKRNSWLSTRPVVYAPEPPQTVAVQARPDGQTVEAVELVEGVA